VVSRSAAKKAKARLLRRVIKAEDMLRSERLP